MYDIYYAHHQWKYGTQVEQYELDLIKRYFPNGMICNPATDLIAPKEYGEEAIMAECLALVHQSDILVFSSMDGVVGTGVYHEVEAAQRAGKLVLYIFQDRLHSGFEISKRFNSTDRLYANVFLNNF